MFKDALLHDPAIVPRGLPLGAPMPATWFPSLPHSRQTCTENHEPLLFGKARLSTVDAYHQLGILPPRACLMRSGLRKRLEFANFLVSIQGLRLTILDAYRTLEEQQQLVDYYGAEASEDQYVAHVSKNRSRPPHTTGGAVDLTLSFAGKPLALGTEYDSFAPEAHALSLETQPDSMPDKKLRRLMSLALTKAGLVGYDKEWWHWSYGDDVWSAATGMPACYDVYEECL